MQVPKWAGETRPVHVVMSGVFLAFVLLGSVAKCSRAMRSDEPSTVRYQTAQSPVINVGEISVGEIVQGTLAVNQRQGWLLRGTKGQRIAIGAFSAWDNHVALLIAGSDLSITEDGFSGGNGQGLIDGVTLPQDGTYQIVVRGEYGGQGSYELHVKEAAPAKPPIVTRVGPGDAPILITQ